MKTNKCFVSPKVYVIGATALDLDVLQEYLFDTGQVDFLEQVHEALSAGINPGEIMCSFYAKACYASLTATKNKNISKIRDIEDNVAGTIKSGHGSVFEHCSINFMVTNCSRVFTHELVRHRVGTAFSQTSGRYVRSDILNVVVDPILEPIEDLCEEARLFLQDWYKRAQLGLRIDEVKDFATKKKMTSALRRFMPNGQSNEIGFSINLRGLRHTIEARTSRHAEWEIRDIFNQIYNIIKKKYPLMFADATEEMIDGFNEVTFAAKKI